MLKKPSDNSILFIAGNAEFAEELAPSLETRGKSYFKLRNNLVEEGVIVERVFARDYELNAPSAASAVILGHTSNGNVDWKTAEGLKLKDL